ncbi:flavocytochrome c [Ligilactobacillus hohenheimensis]|uniref:flavocytochrome c n=1 Tax=Ligilactobacillus hohenheimensis TaxID=2991832 RepID=UPI0024B95227|nr:flavocytochrome c [Ligilactobacillus hohenheimensis]
MAKFWYQPWGANMLKDQYDVVIVGSGATGLVAAIQAKELGLKPAVFEKMEKLGGNSNRASSGMNAAETNVQLRHGIVDSIDDFYNETYQGGGKLNDQDLLHYFTSHAALAVDWLFDHGIKLEDVTITGGMSRKRAHRPASTAPIGAFLIKHLLQVVQEDNVPVFNNTKVTQLLHDDVNRVTGVKLTDENGQERTVKSQAVLLATGGFGAAKDLIKKYRPDLVNYKTTNQEGATGDGLKLAEEVDGQLVDMNFIQIHPTVQQDNPHVYLIGEAVRGEGAILVNGQGERFINELETRKVVSAAITALPEKSAYLIFNQDVRDHAKAIDFYDSVGLVEHGETLEALAKKIGVPADKLTATVDRWNTVVADQHDADFGRTTGLNHQFTAGPFFAIHIAPAIHYSMGGLHIDPQTRVYDTNGRIIPGLYAAGEVAGGLHGNNRIGGNSIADTVIFGQQAGKQITRFVREHQGK